MTNALALHLDFAAQSDVGRVRSQNEDSYAIDPEIGLALVADGMGGHAGGDIASRTAVQAIADFLLEYEHKPSLSEILAVVDEDRTLGESGKLARLFDAYAEIVQNAVQRANQQILEMNEQRGLPEGRGMGTTVVGLWLLEGTTVALGFHAGDSRLYRYRNGRLDLLTRDHSLYQAWLDSGRPGGAPNRNVIMRALGMFPNLQADISIQHVERSDIYLLCSDGLTGMVSEEDITRTLETMSRDSLEATCRHLIDQANAAGGRDNITVVLARVC